MFRRAMRIIMSKKKKNIYELIVKTWEKNRGAKNKNICICKFDITIVCIEIHYFHFRMNDGRSTN